MVIEKMQMHYEMATKIVPKEQIIGVFLRGSQNYGLEIETSDVDTLCLVVPSVEELVRAERPLSEEVLVGEDGGHITFMDIRDFVKKLMSQNPNVLEVLFARFAIRNTDFGMNWYELYSRREEIAHYNEKQMLNTTVCMAITELARMKKGKYTDKGLVLILRLRDLMINYMAGESFENSLRPNELIFLQNIKRGIVVRDCMEGIVAAENAVDCMKKMYNQYIENHSFKVSAELSDFLYKMQYKFCTDHWRWELQEND